MTDQTQLQKAEQSYRIISAVQYIAPAVFLLLAALLPRFSDLGAARDMIVGLLCLFALMDFIFLRFFLVPKIRANLQRLRDSANV